MIPEEVRRDLATYGRFEQLLAQLILLSDITHDVKEGKKAALRGEGPRRHKQF